MAVLPSKVFIARLKHGFTTSSSSSSTPGSSWLHRQSRARNRKLANQIPGISIAVEGRPRIIEGPARGALNHRQGVVLCLAKGLLVNRSIF